MMEGWCCNDKPISWGLKSLTEDAGVRSAGGAECGMMKCACILRDSVQRQVQS
jgi:hypothetical protein